MSHKLWSLVAVLAALAVASVVELPWLALGLYGFYLFGVWSHSVTPPLRVQLAWLLWSLVPLRSVRSWLLNRHWQLMYWRPE